MTGATRPAAAPFTACPTSSSHVRISRAHHPTFGRLAQCLRRCARSGARDQARCSREGCLAQPSDACSGQAVGAAQPPARGIARAGSDQARLLTTGLHADIGTAGIHLAHEARSTTSTSTAGHGASAKLAGQAQGLPGENFPTKAIRPFGIGVGQRGAERAIAGTGFIDALQALFAGWRTNTRLRGRGGRGRRGGTGR